MSKNPGTSRQYVQRNEQNKRMSQSGVRAQKLELPQTADFDADNPFLGNTPTVPQQIVKPDANGVYSFSPNAAAFKWNWNLLNVKNGSSGEVAAGGDTPQGAFTSFQRDFDLSPPMSSGKESKSTKRTNSPVFPKTGRVAKRVSLSKINYSPGGVNEGRLVEKNLHDKHSSVIREEDVKKTKRSDGRHQRPQYKVRRTSPHKPSPTRSSAQRASHRGVNEPAYVKRQGEKTKSRPVRKSTAVVMSRDAIVRTQSAAECVTYVRQDSGGTNYLVYKAKLFNDTIFHADICTATIHAIYALMYLISVMMVIPERKYKDGFPRRLHEAWGSHRHLHIRPLYIGLAIIWACMIVVELFRFTYLFNRRRKMVSNAYVGNLNRALALGFKSGAVTATVISVLSFSLSAALCACFVVYHRYDEDWSEMKSLFWSVGLIHSGIASSAISRQVMFNCCPSTRVVAYEDPLFLRMCFNLASIVPAIAGWCLMHLLVLRYMPIDLVQRSYESLWHKLLDYYTYGGYIYTIVWWIITCTMTIATFSMLDLSIKVSADLYTGYIDYKLLTSKKIGNEEQFRKVFRKALDQAKMHGAMIGMDWWQIPLVLFQTLYC